LRAVEFWKRMKTRLPWRSGELMGSTPIHQNDKLFRPLQAADLYAGLRRLEAERGNQMDPITRQALRVFEDLQCWQRAYSKDDLMELGADIVIRKASRAERRRREEGG
jgi:hypothetical protein